MTPEAPPLLASEPPPPLLTIPAEPIDGSPEQQRDQLASAARDSAFQSTPFAWRGTILAPFTPSRERAIMEHRSAIGAPPWHEALTDPTSFSADAPRMLYFLATDPQKWLTFLALQPRADFATGAYRELNAHAALEVEIQKWTDEKFTGGLEERVQVYQLCLDILTRASSTRARPADPASPEDSGN